MNEVISVLERWHMDVRDVRERVYRASTPRERERWHALWLWSRGWSRAQVAEALDRDAHTIGEWLNSFGERGSEGLLFEQTGGAPPPLAQQRKRS